MRIHNIIFQSVAAVACLVITSCDDFLDIKPKGEVIITTADDYRKMITEAYSIVPEDRGLASFRSDEFIMDATLSSEDISSYKDIWCWNDDSPDATTSSFNWRNYYQVIYEANHTIENKDNITEGTQETINQLVGESYMLRAYMHFLLVNLFGEPYTALADPYTSKSVPLNLDNDVEKVLSRNSVGDVYDHIISDINEAEKYMNVETWDEGYQYRFNTISINALRSRMYLYMGKWSESLAASDSVLSKKNTLSDLSSELPNKYNSVENILALEQVMTANYNEAAKVGRSGLYGKYNSNDLRRSNYFNVVTLSNIYCNKGGGNTYTCSFRVGEIYLNAAEAALQLGDASKSREYLYKLMETRYNSTYYEGTLKPQVDAMDSDALLEFIYEERQRELAFEGHRWFDLRRTTRPEITKTYGGTTYTLSKDDSRYTLRIPSEAISANPLLGE